MRLWRPFAIGNYQSTGCVEVMTPDWLRSLAVLYFFLLVRRDADVHQMALMLRMERAARVEKQGKDNLAKSRGSRILGEL
jgi:hypothetical protein